jgi:hypothetical protein
VLFKLSCLVGLIGWIAQVGIRWPGDRTASPNRPLFVSIALACVWVVAFNATRCLERIEQHTAYLYGGVRHRAYIEISEWINANVPSSGPSLAVLEAGTFGYFTDLHIVDMAGIVTLGVTSETRYRPLAIAKVFRPDYVLLGGQYLTATPGGSLQYRRVAYFPDQGYGEFSLMRRDDPNRSELDAERPQEQSE